MSASTIQLKKLWWAGPLTVFTAIAGVFIVRLIARMILQPPYAPGLEMLTLPIVLTLVFCTAAVCVFALVGRFTKTPVPTYIIISSVFLVISFLPDIAVAFAPFPGAGWHYAITLMIMHVVAGVITVLMLTRLTFAKKA
jgi:hypothetical protein